MGDNNDDEEGSSDNDASYVADDNDDPNGRDNYDDNSRDSHVHCTSNILLKHKLYCMLFVCVQLYFEYLEDSYQAFMKGRDLDDLKEYESALFDKISKN